MNAQELADPIQDERVTTTLLRIAAEDRARWEERSARDGAQFHRDPMAYPENGFSISPAQGELLYLSGRALGVRRVVEFATSIGISTIYLAAAVRDNGGGVVIGSEIVPDKVQTARANVAEAGLSDFVDIREGDARETFRNLEGPLDLVLLDGWPTGETPSLALSVFNLLIPHLRPGAVIMNDNGEEDFLAFIRDPANGFRSMTLPLTRGETELSVRV